LSGRTPLALLVTKRPNFSEEVVRRAQAYVRDFGLAGSWVKLEEIILHEFVDLHDGSLVAASVAVVGCREDCDDVAFVRPVVAIHDQLVGACDSRQVIRMIELFRDVLAEAVACASRRNAPTAAVVGVRPKQIADGALVWGLLNAVQLADLVERVDTR